MSEQPLIKKTLWSIVASIASTASLMVSGVVVARILGVDGTGRIAYLNWVANFCVGLFGLGLSAAVSRFSAAARGAGTPVEADRIEAYLSKACLIPAALGTVSVCLFSFKNPTISASGGTILVATTGALYLASSLSGFYLACLAGRQSFSAIAKVSIISSACQIPAMLVGSVFFGVLGAVAGYTVAAIPGTICYFRNLARSIAIPAVPRDLRRQIWSYALHAWGAALVASLVWSRLEVFFLDRFWGSHMTGLFSAAVSLAAISTAAPMLLGNALVPHFSGLFGAGSEAQVRSTYAATTRLMAFVTIPISLCAAAAAPVLLPLLYGEQFREAVPVASIVILFSWAHVAARPGTSLLFAAKKTHVMLISNAMGGSFMILAGFTLIAQFGAIGGGITRAVLQTLVVVIEAVYVSRWMGFSVPATPIAKMLVLAAVPALAIHFIIHFGGTGKLAILSIALATTIGGLGYLAGCIRWCVLTPLDITSLRNALVLVSRHIPMARKAGPATSPSSYSNETDSASR